MGFTILSLVVSAFLLLLLPILLHPATTKKAGDVAKYQKDTLNSLLNWRDSMIAIISGLVVLQVAVSGKTNSNTSLVANISVATSVPFISILIMLILLVIVSLSYRVKVNQKSFFDGKLWRVFSFCIVLIIYVLTAYFLIIS